MIFYLGTHKDGWLKKSIYPLFISNRTLSTRKTLPESKINWALDSGGFSELSLYGEWRTSKEKYLENINRYKEIGNLDWAAPQDYMCEPFIINKTRLSVKEHQKRTIENFIWLYEREELVIPVIQGFTLDEYLKCVDLYYKYGIDLAKFKTVGIGSVCRRQNTNEIESIIKELSFINLHGFGVKIKGLSRYSKYLKSADSMSWSFNARRNPPIEGHTHTKCTNCYEWACNYYQKIQNILND